jgi:hypothetical protein
LLDGDEQTLPSGHGDGDVDPEAQYIPDVHATLVLVFSQ